MMSLGHDKTISSWHLSASFSPWHDRLYCFISFLLLLASHLPFLGHFSSCHWSTSFSSGGKLYFFVRKKNMFYLTFSLECYTSLCWYRIPDMFNDFVYSRDMPLKKKTFLFIDFWRNISFIVPSLAWNKSLDCWLFSFSILKIFSHYLLESIIADEKSASLILFLYW